MTAVDRIGAAARSVRWSPLVGAPLLASAALLLCRALAGPAAGPMGLVGGWGRDLTCLSLAFLADDLVLTAAPAVPVAARTRFLARIALGLPVVVLGWLALLGAEALMTAGDPSVDPLGAVAFAAGATGIAAAVSRYHPEPSPGAVGAAIAATLVAAYPLVPSGWASYAPNGTLVTAGLLALGLTTAWVATGEPRP